MCATLQFRADAVSGRRRFRQLAKIASAIALALLLAILIYLFVPVPGGSATGQQLTLQQAAHSEPAGTAIACGAIALPPSVGVGDVVASGHLPRRSFHFLIGLKDEYARGKLTVAPGIVCRDGRIGFNLFGGVSREKDYFELEMLEGRLPSQWSYLEQWLIEEKVTFDDGTTLVVNDPLMGTQVPASAKRVVRIQLRMWSGRDAEGHDSEAMLTWE